MIYIAVYSAAVAAFWLWYFRVLTVYAWWLLWASPTRRIMEYDDSKEKAEIGREKIKACKSDLSLLCKMDVLGTKAQIVPDTVYWEPTYKEYCVAVHVPDGWDILDVNGLVGVASTPYPQQANAGLRFLWQSQAAYRH